MTEQGLHDLTTMDRNQRGGTISNEIRDSIELEGDPYKLAEAFRDMTPFDKALGHLYGKLMQAKGNVQVDNCFAWFETEYSEHLGNKPFDNLQKNMILTSVIQQICGAEENGYRSLRQVLVRMNQK
jgi:hypothetical protein